MIRKINDKQEFSNESVNKLKTTNYSPYGIGEHKAKHGYNGQFSVKKNSYFLGNGNRLYLSYIGSFNQQDNLNITNGGEINSYSYAKRNPINYQDPSGNSDKSFYTGNSIGLIAGIIGIVFAIPTEGASLSLYTGVSIALATAEVVATTASAVYYTIDNNKGAKISAWLALGVGVGSLSLEGITAFNEKLMIKSSKLTSSSVFSAGTGVFNLALHDFELVELIKEQEIVESLEIFIELEELKLIKSNKNIHNYKTSLLSKNVVSDIGFDVNITSYSSIAQAVKKDKLIITQIIQEVDSQENFLKNKVENKLLKLIHHENHLKHITDNITKKVPLYNHNIMENHLDFSQINNSVRQNVVSYF